MKMKQINYSKLLILMFLDIEEPTATKYLTTGSEFEYIFETDGPGEFLSCDVHRPGVKDDPLVIGSDKHVTRYHLLSLNTRKP